MTQDPAEYSNLCPEDQRLLDALVESGFDPELVELRGPEDRERLVKLVGLFDLLDDYPVGDADESLVHATLARIDREERRSSARLIFDAETAAVPVIRRIRMPDFITIAAVILIAASIGIPMSTHFRQKSIDSGCANHLRLVGGAFSRYASDYDGRMPLAIDNIGDLGWAGVKNTVNLMPMIENGYCGHDELVCPGHDGPDPSFSYRWFVSGRPAVWGVNQTDIVLGDRNPSIDAAIAGLSIPALSISLNHADRGQNVLSGDGTQMWIKRPLVGANDNIFLPRGVTFLRVGDQPTDFDDVFLTH